MIEALTVCVQYKDTTQRRADCVSRRAFCLASILSDQATTRAYRLSLCQVPNGTDRNALYTVFFRFLWCFGVVLKIEPNPPPHHWSPTYIVPKPRAQKNESPKPQSRQTRRQCDRGSTCRVSHRTLRGRTSGRTNGVQDGCADTP